ncbi:hypothetical protein B0H11DRAFT_2202666 [Mycena galericulata]|nr:hypothetical protein B0H11DRAFT_2202666 [Mycena galericulata]
MACKNFPGQELNIDNSEELNHERRIERLSESMQQDLNKPCARPLRSPPKLAHRLWKGVFPVWRIVLGQVAKLLYWPVCKLGFLGGFDKKRAASYTAPLSEELDAGYDVQPHRPLQPAPPLRSSRRLTGKRPATKRTAAESGASRWSTVYKGCGGERGHGCGRGRKMPSPCTPCASLSQSVLASDAFAETRRVVAGGYGVDVLACMEGAERVETHDRCLLVAARTMSSFPAAPDESRASYLQYRSKLLPPSLASSELRLERLYRKGDSRHDTVITNDFNFFCRFLTGIRRTVQVVSGAASRPTGLMLNSVHRPNTSMVLYREQLLTCTCWTSVHGNIQRLVAVVSAGFIRIGSPRPLAQTAADLLDRVDLPLRALVLVSSTTLFSPSLHRRPAPQVQHMHSKRAKLRTAKESPPVGPEYLRVANIEAHFCARQMFCALYLATRFISGNLGPGSAVLAS